MSFASHCTEATNQGQILAFKLLLRQIRGEIKNDIILDRMSFLMIMDVSLPHTKMFLTLDKQKPEILQQNKILLGGQTINLRARQMVYVLARLIDKDNPYDTIKINVKEFLGFINNNSKEKWTDIYAITNDIFDHLNDNPILVKEPRKKDFKKINWLSSLGVVKGFIEARFSTDIAEFFLYQENKPYTKLLWDLRPYSSSYTARIVELFQKYHRKDSGDTEITFEYDIEDLKLFFGVHNKYSRFFDFEKRVLQTSQKELESSDIIPYWFEYHKIKRGRNVEKIKFDVFIRPKVLLEVVPELKRLSKQSNQKNLFGVGYNIDLTDRQKKIIEKLGEQNIPKNKAYLIVQNLTETQAMACYYLIEYGVNPDLAFTIVEKHCSFGELKDNEHFYVQHTLKLIEEARLKRIEDKRRTGKSKGRITPDDKKGGLPKKVLEEKQHFASFMERLSSIKRSPRTPNRQDSKEVKDTSKVSSIKDIITTLPYSKKDA